MPSPLYLCGCRDMLSYSLTLYDIMWPHHPTYSTSKQQYGHWLVTMATITAYIYYYGNQGHIGSSPLGLDMLLENDIIKEIVLMAANNPVFSVRGLVWSHDLLCDHVICRVLLWSCDLLCDHVIFLSLFRTCFYALCLIAKTKRGVEQLKQLGWVSVCHSHEHKWPVVNKRTSSTSTPQRNVVRDKTPFHHQSSLPAVILTSTDTPEATAAARRKALLKKYTSTMKVTGKVVHNQKITEDKVSEYSDQEKHLHIGSLPDQPPIMRNGNPSPQQRPLSMMSFSSRWDSI